MQTPAVRSRLVALLANIDPILATGVADGLGIEVPPPPPLPLPLATGLPVPAYEPAPSLSLLHRPGATGIHTKKVAILVAAGTDAADVHRRRAPHLPVIARRRRRAAPGVQPVR